MATIITRAGKGSALSADEYDENLNQETNAQSGNYTVTTADNRSTVEYTGSGSESITLPDASTLLAAEDTGAFQVTVKHGGSGTLTIAFNTGDTVDGVDVDLTLQPDESVTLKCGSVTDDWMIVNDHRLVTGIRAYRTANQAHDSGSSGTWDTVIYNVVTNGFNHGTALNTTSGLITLPTWARYFKVNAALGFTAHATGAYRSIALATGSDTDGSTIFEYGTRFAPTAAFVTPVTVNTGWIPASVAASFYVLSYQDSLTALEMVATYMKLYVEFK